MSLEENYQAVEVFLSYASEDKDLLDALMRQLSSLKRLKLIRAWHTYNITAGSEWKQAIADHLAMANVILLLVSAHFIDSDYCYSEEMVQAMKRHEAGQTKVIPIILRPVDYSGLPFAKLQCLPQGGVAVTSWQKTDEAFYTIARDIGKVVEELSGQLRESVEHPGSGNSSSARPDVPGVADNWPDIWYVPYPRNPFFTGRKELLVALREQLLSRESIALMQANAISGLGGIGKTQIALEYTYRYKREYRYVLWTNANSEEVLRAGMVQLAAYLQIPGQDMQDQQGTIEALKRWLAQHTDWLLVLDNADNLELVAKYLPQKNQERGHILLTTRASTGGAFAQMIEVEKMSIEEGMLLLLLRAHLIAFDASHDRSTGQDQVDARAIVVALDGLPLALDQAGAYIEEMDITLSDYLALYQTRRAILLSHRGQLPPGHPDTVATTWDLSFQQVALVNPDAANLLRFCAFLAPDVIPETILTQGAACDERLENVATDPTQLNTAIQILRRYSLIRRNRRVSTLSIHRLVQAVLRDTMPEPEQRIWAESAANAINAVFPTVDYGNWRQAQPYLSHAYACCELIKQYQFTSLEATSLLSLYGDYFFYTAQYAEAELLYRRALHIREQILGVEHLETANTLHALGSLCQQLGRYTEAESLYQRALHIREQTLGSNHHKTGSILHQLASLYQQQDKLTEVESLYQRALRIREQTLGSEHPYTSDTLLALASLYQQQDKLTEAELLYQRALHIREQTLGSEHPDTSSILLALASLYQLQDKYVEAEKLYQRALHSYEQRLSPEHPRTADVLHGLASLYKYQGKLIEAEELYLRALGIHKQALSPEHPDTANILRALGRLYRQQGKYDEAELFYQRTLRIYEHVWGLEHRRTGAILHSLGSLYRQQSKYAEAERLYQRALRIYKLVLGSEDLDTQKVLYDLVSLYEEQGKHTEVDKLYLPDAHSPE